ncbi:helix-hairpin-helix domain-containing protein [Bacilliculturomica massiliensis]|uniref:helix-hairpin-helix domain-containing protein n=1 Tax=Bacilliculturomica massiliensis TaxID=1917867 RepID=UPI00102FF55C|nr:helix-hairpin-helix domain-containing protein [Bacilliculturomica massiliensis]
MTRESQMFAAMKKKKMMAGCCFIAVVLVLTILKGGVLFQEKEEIITESGECETSGSETASGDQGEGRSASSGQINGEASGGTHEEAGSGVPRMVVDVAGAVSSPGIYILPQGSRVYEAVDQAGGLTEESDLREINLAAELLDGEKLYIPSRGDYAQSAETEGRSAGGDVKETGCRAGSDAKKININTADSSELQTLNGVGPSTARRILDYRRENGRFRAIDELKNVKGIGDKTFQKLKESISVT